MILDVVCLWISFTLAFNMRHGSLDVLANSLYRDMMWSLALMDIVVIFFFDSLTAIYESLHWKKEFSFKFRGITKERGMSKILVFSLDEPQIIVGKKYKNHPDVEKESNQPFGFVKYKTDTGQENKPENNAIVCAYPEEWMKRRIGINYFIREQRDSMINAITEEDIEETGVVVENPVIGHIPSRQEIVNELEELLMTM